jgi:hypothetical protein
MSADQPGDRDHSDAGPASGNPGTPRGGGFARLSRWTRRLAIVVAVMLGGLAGLGAFTLDYREARGHAYMLYDQTVTEPRHENAKWNRYHGSRPRRAVREGQNTPEPGASAPVTVRLPCWIELRAYRG